MATIETQVIIHTEETMYRVRPTPDSDCTSGKDGLVIEWKDVGEEYKWCGYTYLPAEVVPLLIEALKKYDLK
jgi:hypothetical protein